MKIAFSSSGNNLESQLDPRFGRCPKFLIVDLDTMDIDVYENENSAMGGGAGIQTAQFIASKGVDAVITGRCGPNAVQMLNAAGVKLYSGQTGTIRDLIDRFLNGKMTAATQPNAPAHAGIGGKGMGGGRGSGDGRRMGGRA